MVNWDLKFNCTITHKIKQQTVPWVPTCLTVALAFLIQQLPNKTITLWNELLLLAFSLKTCSGSQPSSNFSRLFLLHAHLSCPLREQSVSREHGLFISFTGRAIRLILDSLKSSFWAVLQIIHHIYYHYGCIPQAKCRLALTVHCQSQRDLNLNRLYNCEKQTDQIQPWLPSQKQTGLCCFGPGSSKQFV